MVNTKKNVVMEKVEDVVKQVYTNSEENRPHLTKSNNIPRGERLDKINNSNQVHFEQPVYYTSPRKNKLSVNKKLKVIDRDILYLK